MDFMMVPGAMGKRGSSQENPYFYEFMFILGKIIDLCITDPPVWLWICGGKEMESQVVYHILHYD